MKRLLYLLAANKEIQYELSKYTTISLALQDNNTVLFKTKSQGIFNKEKQVVIDKNLNKDNKVLEGIWDIDPFKDFIIDTYDSEIDYREEAKNAKEDVLSYVLWLNSFNEEDEYTIHRLFELIENKYYLPLGENDYLKITDDNNIDTSPFAVLHIQFMHINKVDDDKIELELPEYTANEIADIFVERFKKDKDYFTELSENMYHELLNERTETRKRYYSMLKEYYNYNLPTPVKQGKEVEKML